MKHQYITATIELLTGLHAGGNKDDQITDLPFARDLSGSPYIPGTSIAGAMRNYCNEIAASLGVLGAKCPICKLFGQFKIDNDKQTDNNEQTGTKSALSIYNAIHKRQIDTTYRDNTGINRVTGAVFDKAKYDYEVVASGNEFDFKIKIDDGAIDFTSDEVTEESYLFAVLLKEWKSGRGILGGGASKGLGRFELSDMNLYIWDMDSPKGLMGYLRSDKNAIKDINIDAWIDSQISKGKELYNNKGDYSEGNIYEQLNITFNLRAKDLLLVSELENSIKSGCDNAFQTEGAIEEDINNPKNMDKIFIQGSTIRGFLRSHGEEILRTMTLNNSDNYQQYLNACPACRLFENDVNKGLTGCSWLYKLNFNDIQKIENPEKDKFCLACQLFGCQLFGSRLRIADAKIRNPHEVKSKKMDFVSIDRFTGGVKTGAKFDAYALVKPEFTINIELVKPQLWEIGLLTLIIRDIADEMLCIGYGKSKGFGRVTTDEIVYTLRSLDSTANKRYGINQECIDDDPFYCWEQKISVKHDTDKEAVSWDNWLQECVKALYEKVKAYTREEQWLHILGDEMIKKLWDREVN